MPGKAAERVERALAEGKQPAREDLETLIQVGYKWPAVKRINELLSQL